MELLAPAGSYEAAKAATAAGADAVYMGGPLFSARAYADSSKDGKDPDIIPGDAEHDPLIKTIRYCHLHNVKVYMTLNTLMKETELEGLENYLKPYVENRIDAFIVQDLGLLQWLKEKYPHIALHISTQAAVTGPRYAKRLKEFGAVRVVPARELSLEELKEIAGTGIEVEAFIHGALCYSYSGQCLMSSFIGCRSGNRGRCAGTCRLPLEAYDHRFTRVGEEEENYLMSMKDLCTLKRLSELQEAGVCSLKIEGRMKSPVYVAGVVSIYRKWLDALEYGIDAYNPDNDILKLKELFDRGGFTDAYLNGRNGRDCLILTEKPECRVPDQIVISEITEKYINKEIRIPVVVTGIFQKGCEAVLRLETSDGKFHAEAKGTVVEEASRKPVTEEEIREKILAFGNTCFEPVETIFHIDNSVFVPLGTLKEIRRRACEELEKSILKGIG